MRRQAGNLARKLVLAAALLMSALLVVTPFALAQDSEQSILNSQSAFGLPDVVADELPGAAETAGPDVWAVAARAETLSPDGHSTRLGAGDRRDGPSLATNAHHARGPPTGA